jgi:hypothetical protein
MKGGMDAWMEKGEVYVKHAPRGVTHQVGADMQHWLHTAGRLGRLKLTRQQLTSRFLLNINH